jgi:hypothetical protein
MSSIFDKLNLKHQSRIVVLNAPETFERELSALHRVAVLRSLEGVQEIEFSLAFVTQQKELDTLAKSIARLAKSDALLWFAYPKGTSKRYRCEFNRDTGWDVLGKLGFEAVRSVAIDEDWTGARFRRVEHIKTMTRAKERALTVEGKARTAKRQ